MGKFSLTNFSVFRNRKPADGEAKSKAVSSGPANSGTGQSFSPQALIYDEYHLTPREYLGCALMLCAVILVQLPEKKTANELT